MFKPCGETRSIWPFRTIALKLLPTQYSSLMVIGMEDDTRPPLLLVTIAVLLGMAELGGVGVVVEAA